MCKFQILFRLIEANLPASFNVRSESDCPLNHLDTACDYYIMSIDISSATINLERAALSSSVSQAIQVKKSDSITFFWLFRSESSSFKVYKQLQNIFLEE